MKVFAIPLLSIIFLVLLSGSIKSVATDSLESDTGIFFDEVASNIELEDSKYQVYAQITHRNEDGQLISVIESSLAGAYTPHKITDDIFDTLMGKKEIVTIDNVKYEKVQYTFSPTHKERLYSIFPIFSDNPLPPVDYTTAHENMHDQNMEISNLRNYYCTTFKEHGYDCIPIFQVLAPVITVEPHDIMSQQWTIFRVLN